MDYGYVRHSPYLPKMTEQLIGLDLADTFTDYAETMDHYPELDRLLSILKKGDNLIVKSADRIGANARDVLVVAEKVVRAGATLVIVDAALKISKEKLELLSAIKMISVLDHFTVEVLQKEIKTGPKPSLTAAQADEVRRRAESGEMVSKLAIEYGVSRASLYKKYGVRRKKLES